MPVVDFKGQIETEDYAQFDVVKKAFKATLDGQELNVKWSKANKADKKFTFKIHDLDRAQEDKTLVLSMNGKALNAKKAITKQLTVPAVDVFKLVNTELENSREQSIELQFSDPIQHDPAIRGHL